MMRKLEAVVSIILKSFFLYDILHLCIIKPIEGLFYKRLSSSLIVSSSSTIHMSFDFQELFELRRIKSPTKKLFRIKKSFIRGLEKLDFNNEQKYYTYVNEVFYSIVSGDKKIEAQGITFHIISSVEKNQAEAKLLLVQPLDVWQKLLSDDKKDFIQFLFRKEKILRVEFLKPSVA